MTLDKRLVWADNGCMTDTETYRFDQYYVFTGPDGWAWCEMFYNENGAGHHVTCPTPFKDVQVAIAKLQAKHTAAYVDELMAEDIAEALTHTFTTN